jgi:ABC-type transport system involved in multi-copper enzyme maturation permease subunit
MEIIFGILLFLLIIALVVFLLVYFIKILLIGLVVASAAIIAALIPFALLWLLVTIAKNSYEQGLGMLRSVLIPLLAVLLGAAVGFYAYGGIAIPLVLGAASAATVALSGLLLYPEWNNQRLLTAYREQETRKRLIKP